MAIPTEDVVVIRRGQTARDPVEITVNCPDKVGLACDLTRVMFEFGLNVVKGDISTDGRWCFIVFWVVVQHQRLHRPASLSSSSTTSSSSASSSSSSSSTSTKGIKWSLLRHRLSSMCPTSDPVFFVPTSRFHSSSSTSSSSFSSSRSAVGGMSPLHPSAYPSSGRASPTLSPSSSSTSLSSLASGGGTHPKVFLLQVHAQDRHGLLNDMTQVLWELEMTILKVHVSTSPDGNAIDFFFVSDNRGELPAKHRVDHVCDKMKEVLGKSSDVVFCDLHIAGGSGGVGSRSTDRLEATAAVPTSGAAAQQQLSHLQQQQQQQQHLLHQQLGSDVDAMGLGVSDAIPFAVQQYLLPSPPSEEGRATTGEVVSTHLPLSLLSRGFGAVDSRGATSGVAGLGGAGPQHHLAGSSGSSSSSSSSKESAGGGRAGGDGGSGRGGTWFLEFLSSSSSSSHASPVPSPTASSAVAHAHAHAHPHAHGHGHGHVDAAAASLGMVASPSMRRMAMAHETKVSVDNAMSPVHSLLQVSVRDRKGLVYDCLRTLRDFNLQVAYGRISTSDDGKAQLDMFMQTTSGGKLQSQQDQLLLCRRMKEELDNPIRIVVISRGAAAAAAAAAAATAAQSDTSSAGGEDVAGRVFGASSGFRKGDDSSHGQERGPTPTLLGLGLARPEPCESGSSSSTSTPSLSSAAGPVSRDGGDAASSAAVAASGTGALAQSLDGADRAFASLNSAPGDRSGGGGGASSDSSSISSNSSSNRARGQSLPAVCAAVPAAVADAEDDAELLVATPVERCGRGRPRALYDVTYVLRQLDVQVFKADIARHCVAGRTWEVYRLILQDKDGQPITKHKTRVFIADQVRAVLMG